MITIIGSGGHGRMLAALLGETPWMFVDEQTAAECNDAVMIGVGNLTRLGDPGLMKRRLLFERFNIRVVGYRHPSAVIIGQVTTTAQVMPLAVVNAYATVGENCIVNSGAVIEHDCVVGAHAHIAPGAVLCGRVGVGDGTHIGAGSVVKQGVIIGARCMIAMGSVVVKDIPDGGTWLKGRVV